MIKCTPTSVTAHPYNGRTTFSSVKIYKNEETKKKNIVFFVPSPIVKAHNRTFPVSLFPLASFTYCDSMAVLAAFLSQGGHSVATSLTEICRNIWKYS